MNNASIESHRTLHRFVFPMLIIIGIVVGYRFWKLAFPYDRVLTLIERMERVQKKKQGRVELFRVGDAKMSIFIPMSEIPEEHRPQWITWAKHQCEEQEPITLKELKEIVIMTDEPEPKFCVVLLTGIDAKGEKHDYTLAIDESMKPPYMDPGPYLSLMEQRIRPIESELKISVNTWFPVTEFVFLMIAAIAIVVYFIVVK